MSTIETLAMAIDAKDQITHGHIRRVQHFAIGLAKAVGVNDKEQINAIEAASLLHDMGKLAVPEYILNKPGALTPAEFEKMKLHASVGADILSAIDFPYPVVPIVRHHHENWDGTGYPDGLSGSHIPIGARILSVVDCFDALTSDRPYRPRLSDSEAIKILLSRRGSMYDPVVVDTFLSVYTEIAPPEDFGIARDSLKAIARGLSKNEADSAGAGLDDIAASTEEMLVLYDLARALGGHLDLPAAADVISKHLRRVVPTSTFVFYVYDSESDELVVAHAAGEHSSIFAGLRIPRGQRLTGWVAANKQTIVNSDPILDLGEVARSMKPRLLSCLSTPLLIGNDLVGVLSIYSADRNSFTEDHRRIIEVAAKQVSKAIKHAFTLPDTANNSLSGDLVTGLPTVQHLESYLNAEMMTMSANAMISLIFVNFESLAAISRRHGKLAADQALNKLASEIRSALRSSDSLFRYDKDNLVILLRQTDAPTADAVATRVLRLGDEEHFIAAGVHERIRVRTGVATAPADGITVEALISSARRRERTTGDSPNHRPPSVH
jgi:diguanylate cyclase (GGDEF)-like protein/putative nucleotidyltransferase with HDIG domain